MLTIALYLIASIFFPALALYVVHAVDRRTNGAYNEEFKRKHYARLYLTRIVEAKKANG